MVPGKGVSSMKDAKGHGSDKRNGSGQFTGAGFQSLAMNRAGNAKKERLALRALADQRRYMPDRVNTATVKPPTMYASTVSAGHRGERVDLPVAHQRGV